MLEKIKSFLFKNTTARQTVAKNSFWLSVSNIGGRLLKAIIILYAARVLSTSGYGLFSYAVYLAGFFTLFVDPGVNAMVMREIPKLEDADRRKFFSTSLILKLGFVIFGAACVLFIAPYFSTLDGAKILLPLVALIITFDSFREFFSAYMRAREKMEWEAGVFLFTNLVIVVAGFILLIKSPTPYSFTLAYTIGSIAGALLAFWVIRDYFKEITTNFTKALVLPIIRSAWPFAVAGSLGALLTTADVLIISWMRGASDVGVYSAAVRIVQLLYIVPVILQYSTLPLMARLAGKDDERFKLIFERTLGVIFLASVPLALGGIVLGTQIMVLLFGSAYAAGGISFKILMLTLLFDFPLTVISSAVFAYDSQKKLIISSAIAGVGNVVFDLALIPFFGIAGSAVATLIAQILTNWYLWHTMKKLNRFELFPRLKKIFVAGTLMGAAAMTLMLLGVNVIVNVILCSAFYVALLYWLRESLLREMLKGVQPAPTA